MNSDTAKQIVDLVNIRNDLPEDITPEDVYNGSYFFLEQDLDEDKKELISCVRAKRMSFFAYELKHLSVNPSHERKGYGEMMVKIVEEYAASKRVPLVMATSKASNAPVNRLFLRLGYSMVSDFVNSKTGHSCHIWQKVL